MGEALCPAHMILPVCERIIAWATVCRRETWLYGCRRRRMQFGLYSSIANPPHGEHLDRCVDQVIAEAQLAEASGFDACFFGEHHQDKDGFLPSPLIVATAVAAEKRTSELEPVANLVTRHHPVQASEEEKKPDIIPKGAAVPGGGVRRRTE